MRICKLFAEERRTMTIERTTFERATNKRPPWYRYDDRPGGGAQEHRYGRQYAVCPACNNPIQIIGLYENLAHSNRPYGRHTGKPTEGFPVYDAEAYNWCPFVVTKKASKSSRKRKLEGLPLEILQLVRSQFDRIVHIIERDTGLRLSRPLARKMLATYLAERGHLYVGASLRNVPWMLAYLSDSQGLFGQRIGGNAELTAAVRESLPNAALSPDGRLVKGTGYYAVYMCFVEHRQSVEDGALRERMQFLVTDHDSNDVYEKTIVFDHDYFERLIDLDPARARRDPVMVEIGAEMVTRYAADMKLTLPKPGARGGEPAS